MKIITLIEAEKLTNGERLFFIIIYHFTNAKAEAT
jgi:hypothetical protein